MNRRNSAKTTAITTACIGAAVGAAYMLSGNNKKFKSKTKRLRKNTGKALRQAGGFINSVGDMVK